ncbi:pantetheine-phosphate adenylyltransferase [Chloroflexota bacterium]
MTIALYPGSFDPVTNGHLDIASRAAAFFDQLIIGVYDVPQKYLLFTTEERIDLMRKSTAHLPNVRVESYSGLTTEFAQRMNARVLVRGLRMASDFEREFEMALMTKKLAPDIEYLCLMSSLEFQFLSASLLKEVAEFGGCITDLVPEPVAVALAQKYNVPKIAPKK